MGFIIKTRAPVFCPLLTISINMKYRVFHCNTGYNLLWIPIKITILSLSGENGRLYNEGSLVFSRCSLVIKKLFEGMLVFFKLVVQ